MCNIQEQLNRKFEFTHQLDSKLASDQCLLRNERVCNCLHSKAGVQVYRFVKEIVGSWTVQSFERVFCSQRSSSLKLLREPTQHRPSKEQRKTVLLLASYPSRDTFLYFHPTGISLCICAESPLSLCLQGRHDTPPSPRQYKVFS